MFNLEKEIANWRRQMQSAGIKSSRALEELESHLRQEMARQIKGGLSAPAAFEASVHQVGPADALGAEFAKSSEDKERRARKLKLVCLACAGLGYLMPLVLNASHILQQLNVMERWLALGAVVVTEISLFSGLFLYRLLPVIPEKRIRTQVQFTCALPLFIWLCVFAYVILGRLELTLGQIMVATLWGMTPLTVFGGLICGLDEAVHRRAHAD